MNPGSNHGRRLKARQTRQREILLAASEAFAALGYDLANMQLIAEAAGMTKATLYAHFGNKAELFRAVIEHCLEELPEPALAAPVAGNLRTQLNQIAQALLRQAGHPASLTLTRLLARSNWVPPKRWRQRHRPYRSYLEKALSQCTRCNDPAQAATQFLLLTAGSLDPANAMQADQSRVAAAVELFVKAYAELEPADCA